MPFLRGEAATEIVPSAYWITYVYTELATRGYGAEVVADIEARWQKMAGFGTTFEDFTACLDKKAILTRGRASAVSSHADPRRREADGSGLEGNIICACIRGGITHGQGTPSPQGIISSQWKREERTGASTEP